MVNFMDFYYTGPDTLAGRYMRKFWHPVFRAQDLKPGWAKPIKILANSLRSIAATAASPMSSTFAVRIASRNSPSVGSKTTRFAAAFTAGSSIKPDNASNSPPRKNPSPKKCASAVVRPRNTSA